MKIVTASNIGEAFFWKKQTCEGGQTVKVLDVGDVS
jgi:hypothetical protein